MTETTSSACIVDRSAARLYYVRRSDPPVRDRIHIVHNWFSELQKLVPTE